MSLECIQHTFITPFHFIASKASSGAPVIEQELENVLVRAGDPFELHATIKGTPTPMIQWMKDRKFIQSSDELILAAKKGVYSLFVRAATKADQGYYRYTHNSKYKPKIFNMTVSRDVKSNEKYFHPTDKNIRDILKMKTGIKIARD